MLTHLARPGQPEPLLIGYDKLNLATVQSFHMDYSILIVDDDPQLRSLCRTALQEVGYSVRAVGNGKEALAAIKATAFQLILLDLSMPDMDGFEFLKVVHAKSPKLKIVVISGFLGGTMLKAAKLFGAAATLAKPFPTDSLLALVDEVLSGNSPASSG